MRSPRTPYGLSGAAGALVALWAMFIHGRSPGGSVLAGCAFFALGVGTVAVFRARSAPWVSFLVLGGLYFLALAGLRWVTGAAVGPADVFGGALYGLVLTCLRRGQGGGAGKPPSNRL